MRGGLARAAVSVCIQTRSKVVLGSTFPTAIQRVFRNICPPVRGLPTLRQSVDKDRAVAIRVDCIIAKRACFVLAAAVVEQQLPAVAVEHDIQFVLVLMTVSKGPDVKAQVVCIGFPPRPHCRIPCPGKKTRCEHRRISGCAPGGNPLEIGAAGIIGKCVLHDRRHAHVPRIVDAGTVTVGRHDVQQVIVSFFQARHVIRRQFGRPAQDSGLVVNGTDIVKRNIVVAWRQLDLRAIGQKLYGQLVVHGIGRDVPPCRSVSKLRIHPARRVQPIHFHGKPVAGC